MNQIDDPVKLALRIDRELKRRATPEARDKAIEFLWFTYVGRHFDWFRSRLVKKAKLFRITCASCGASIVVRGEIEPDQTIMLDQNDVRWLDACEHIGDDHESVRVEAIGEEACC